MNWSLHGHEIAGEHFYGEGLSDVINEAAVWVSQMSNASAILDMTFGIVPEQSENSCDVNYCMTVYYDKAAL